MDKYYYGIEWAYGIGNGEPTYIRVFDSAKDLQEWIDDDITHVKRERATCKMARKMMGHYLNFRNAISQAERQLYSPYGSYSAYAKKAPISDLVDKFREYEPTECY